MKDAKLLEMNSNKDIIDVLIVDDEPEIRSNLTEILKEEGFSCFSVGDGEAALKALEIYPHFSLILCDIQMPKLNGLEFLVKIRALYSDRHTLVFLTGNGDKSKLLEALRLGAADFIDKPFNISELVSTVQRLSQVGARQQKVWEARFENPTAKSEAQMKSLLAIVNSEAAKKVS